MSRIDLERTGTQHASQAERDEESNASAFGRLLTTPLPQGIAVQCAAYAAALALFGLWHWTASFGDMTVEQILLHLKYANGLVHVDSSQVIACLGWVLGWPLLLSTTLVPIAFALLHLVGDHPSPRASRMAASADRGLRALPLPIAVLALWLLGSHLHIVEFAMSFQPDEYLAQHYLPPNAALLRPHEPRNLVLIYAESMEADYADKNAFGRDLIAPLNDLHALSFDRYEQLQGTGWTIAAMVATQCGVPLKIVTLWDSNTQGQMMNRFLSRATCLTDLLHDEGYRNVFMGGASLTFGGKGKFLRSHHYDEILGLDQWRASGLDNTHFSGWGMHDDDLFKGARGKIDDLHAAGHPFSLVLLTVDTHSPHGQVSAECQKAGAVALDQIISCSSRQIAGFVHYVQQHGYDRDTQIVIIGDHLTMPSTLSDQIAQVPHRSIFNAFVSPEPHAKARESLVHFDMLPTILDFMGLQVAGGKLGLGDSAFQDGQDATIDEQRQKMVRGLQHQSRTYVNLW